jgi:hypothetical protein
VDLPDWNWRNWAEVVVRARADHTSAVVGMGLRFNVRDDRPTSTACVTP